MTIDFYTWGTPNGRKVSIMLEECALPYVVHKVDIGKNDQFKPEFLKVNPNSKIPAIVDRDGPGGGPFTLWESGAILIYLSEKSGRLLPSEPRARHTTLQWLMFQMAGVGPMAGQAHHFMRFAPEKVPYAIERYGKEIKRLYGVIERQLAAQAHLAGPDYSIADIATYPWIARHEWHGVALAEFPNVKRWFEALGARPAVVKGMAVPG
ncbi:MAG: glutathione S-transferase N-terminal domain-containing protein [Alphaproteobacteria bacterium]|nr:glutathione S-transferase N-terminal domain-containing protein [Alphaproteobacteria bacterium]